MKNTFIYSERKLDKLTSVIERVCAVTCETSPIGNKFFKTDDFVRHNQDVTYFAANEQLEGVIDVEMCFNDKLETIFYVSWTQRKELTSDR
jgi:hypothetical protein